MNKRKDNPTTLQPGNPNRGNPDFAVIVALRDWTESSMPDQTLRHPECERNELFLMNVHPVEFAWFDSGNVPMQDFKEVRLGKVAYLTGSITKKVDAKLNFRPMFGRLKRSARLKRKEEKETKKADKKKAKHEKKTTKPRAAN